MRKNINNKINKVFEGSKETLWAYPKGANSFGSNFDPIRNTGYVEAFDSPIPVKAVAVHQISNTGLVAKELGLSLTGAIQVIVNDTDKELVKNAGKLKYNGKFYTTFHEALGSRVMMDAREFEMTSFTLFIKGNS